MDSFEDIFEVRRKRLFADKISCFGNENTIALKRELVSNDYSLAHSCANCMKLAIPIVFRSDRRRNYSIQVSKTTDEIHNYATGGCLWWSMFSLKLKAKQPNQSENESADWELDSQTACPYDATYIYNKSSDVNNFPGSYSLGSPINTNPGSEKSVQLISSWLKTCSAQHNCGITDLPPSLPTTLIAVGEKRIRLLDTAGHSMSRYVALSYCWGTQEQKTLLTKENKQRLLDDIPFEDLDTTIQEAVDITRKIGFKYLWIDALCITQNDRKEKSHEMARMHEIYRNATLTIIASRAAGVREGFLSKRNIAGSEWPQCIFEFPCLDEGIVVPGRTVILVRVDDICSKHEPWDRRAWTLQERVMSKRCLQFGTENTTWSCRHANVQYTDSDGWIPVQYKTMAAPGDDSLLSDASFLMNQPVLPSQFDRRIRTTWHEILEEFSKRGLGYQSDRLPAISSVAKRFAVALNDTYICGLWKSQLHVDLLWSRSYNRFSKTCAHPYEVKPSWSWAASQSNIYHPDDLVYKDDNFEFLGHSMEPEPEGNVYGVAVSANIRVRGLITSIPRTILTDTRANLVGIFEADAMSEAACYRRDEDGEFQESEQRKCLLIKRKRRRRRTGKKDRITDLSNTLVCTGVLIDSHQRTPRRDADNGNQGQAVSKQRPKLTNMNLSLFIIGHEKDTERNRITGPAGLLIAKKKNGAYYRLGRFNVWDVWGLGRKHWEGYTHPGEEEYKSRLLYLWGGKSSIREVTLE
ncbi:HET-domain-containing protein [Hypoxylon rubiginosum]|uniref:HET-domain-containing protein n=1 Tax=Hypoxylon rubiginosum TaxID=110542 RepID=A0ACC0CMR2_9PEZI|nr:HET-domain-containing protein [Hypoxylon rubiginosum]